MKLFKKIPSWILQWIMYVLAGVFIAQIYPFYTAAAITTILIGSTFREP